jgi:hypothetical protein
MEQRTDWTGWLAQNANGLVDLSTAGTCANQDLFQFKIGIPWLEIMQR